ncbi:MAG: QueT transporter family protein [Oscillospiraceae bacterium]|nr:QueT transporter family protein [Oscillospiraceae bacterium]MDY3219804.1 QueT transporter family protein [Candidatus Fimivivens sp.]
MKKISVRTLTRCAVIAALYAAVSIAMLPLAFGAVQARVSEALTLLPVLTPLAVPGVTIGCLITNAYGVAAGANILGAADILLGTAATLAAALLTRALRRFTVFGLPLPASLPPVLLNAVVVGGELTWAEANTLHTPLLWVNMAQVGLGQLVSCMVLGVLLVWTLKKAGLDVRLFGREQAE